jgi:hypothetical protein
VHSRLLGRSGSQKGGEAPREALDAGVVGHHSVEHDTVGRLDSRQSDDGEAAPGGETQADYHQAAVIGASRTAQRRA